MRINNNIYKPSFKGYSNLVTNCHKNEDGGIFTYLSMQLNDNGKSDLSEFKKLKEFNNNSDVVMFSFTRYKNGYMGDFIINDIPLPNSDHLEYVKDIANQSNRNSNYFIDIDTLDEYRNIFKDSNLTTDEFKKNEKTIMKAYTLFASLTKRISNDNSLVKNENFKKVFLKTLDYLTNIVQSESDAMISLSDATLNKTPIQKVAGFLNSQISKNMMKYFK